MNTFNDLLDLEKQLLSFNLEERRRALQELIGIVKRNDFIFPMPQNKINMHCHTFFSFNAYGHSPSSLAWLAKNQGFQFIGIVDFDVLDGVDEFLDACEILRMKGTAGIETRVFIPEFCNDEINSPGEPGVAYHMGVGFSSGKPSVDVESVLVDLRKRANLRNQQIIERVNKYLDPISINYEHDVYPLTPANTPTERHIVIAYTRKVDNTISNPIDFWADKLSQNPIELQALYKDPASLQNLIRTKLMKQGGPGYISPSPESFPTVDVFHKFIIKANALPCYAWLDGTTSGEKKIDQLLDMLVAKGVALVNIIPDRNWNYKDPETKKLKVAELNNIITLTKKMDLPLYVGTEMNSFGQKIVDDFENDVLFHYWNDFVNGANFVYGHTLMHRYCQMGYHSNWAKVNLSNRHNRNNFYIKIGSLNTADTTTDKKFGKITLDMTPHDIYKLFD